VIRFFGEKTPTGALSFFLFSPKGERKKRKTGGLPGVFSAKGPQSIKKE
jgi:hypothetical protein